MKKIIFVLLGITMIWTVACDRFQLNDSSSAQSSVSESLMTTQQQVLLAFWNAVVKSDFPTVEEHAGFPFWFDHFDSILVSMEELKSEFNKEAPFPPVTVGKITEITGNSILSDRLTKSYMRFTVKTKDENAKYFIVELILSGETIKNICRLQLVNDRWKVTGFDD